jgi:5-methylcytosine-specific restriction endonuclease McrA
MNPLYPAVAERAEHRCEYCRAPEAIFNLAFEVEHILPTSRGGPDDLANLALACRACNVYKGSRIDGWDEESGVDVPLFDPRTNDWNQHFTIDSATGTIFGLNGPGPFAGLTLDA